MPRPEISFEFFPPKSFEGTFRLWDAVHSLAPLAPRFVSVTYGAGGTTRALTHDVVATLTRHTGLRTAAHLTCVNASRAETLEIARDYARAGVQDIVALRGDPPKGSAGFEPHPDGFADSVDLIAALAAEGGFTIRVGAYPDVHPEAASAKADVDWLKRKLDAGATEALTQFFFEAETYFRFRDACAKAGIDHMITPGILPIENWKGARRFAECCGTRIPAWLCDAFEKAERDDRCDLLATALCTELCDTLLEGGVERLHFYTLNRPELTRDVCHALGLAPAPALQEVA
jgi:methylenetetrahydrofolate reductase (NADPH)